jgi:hypothetical protein
MEKGEEREDGPATCLTNDHKYQMILTIADYIALAITNLQLRETCGSSLSGTR